MSHNYFVYYLLCSDGSYYIGVTNNVERRMMEHEQGTDQGCYTFERRPVKLVHTEWFNDVRQAIDREKQVKRWSRKKKEALISGDWKKLALHSLAHSRQVFLPLGRDE